jgi:hypothetical protein
MVNIRENKHKFIKAIKDEAQLQIWYLSEEGGTHRKVDPWYLLKRFDKHYYLIGYCHYRKEVRTFHLRRIERFSILDKPIVEKPISLSKIIELKRKQDFSDFFANTEKFTAYGYPEKYEENLKKLGVKLVNELIDDNTFKITNNNLPIKKTHNGYPQTIHLSKMDIPAKCRSPLEHKVLLELENDKRVRLIQVEPIKIQYFYKRVSHLYTPDLIVHYTNGKKDLVEVKLSGDIGQPKNQAKFNAAVKFAEERGMRFFIIGTLGNSRPHTDRSDWSDMESIEIEVYDSTDISHFSPHDYTYVSTKKKRKPSHTDYPIVIQVEEPKEINKVPRKVARYWKLAYKIKRLKKRARHWRSEVMRINNRKKTMI